MPIRVRHVVQCDACHGYLINRPPQDRKALGTTTQGATLAQTFTGCHAAEVEAILRGWSVYPVLCPECVALVKSRVHQEAASEQVRDHRNPEQDRRGVPQSGQGPE